MQIGIVVVVLLALGAGAFFLTSGEPSEPQVDPVATEEAATGEQDSATEEGSEADATIEVDAAAPTDESDGMAEGEATEEAVVEAEPAEVTEAIEAEVN